MYVNASPFKIILGSSSIHRQKVLVEMGYKFTTMTADMDEKSIRKEKPEELVMALALAKDVAIVSKLQYIDNVPREGWETYTFECGWHKAIIPKLPIGDHKNDAEPTLLITCDQVVAYEGMIREKPSSKEEARQFIKGYSGGHAAIVGSVLVTNLKTGFRKGEWDKAEIEEGIVLNIAGGLITEHLLILPFVKQVVGTTDSLLGLPKALTERFIKEVL